MSDAGMRMSGAVISLGLAATMLACEIVWHLALGMFPFLGKMIDGIGACRKGREKEA